MAGTLVKDTGAQALRHQTASSSDTAVGDTSGADAQAPSSVTPAICTGTCCIHPKFGWVNERIFTRDWQWFSTQKLLSVSEKKEQYENYIFSDL